MKVLFDWLNIGLLLGLRGCVSCEKLKIESILGFVDRFLNIELDDIEELDFVCRWDTLLLRLWPWLWLWL